MPKIIIREYDNTKAGATEYANFSVVVPGVCGNPIGGTNYPRLEVGDDGCTYYVEKVGADKIKVFDENGVYECSSQSNFDKYVGKVGAASAEAIACEIIGGSGGTKSEAEWKAAKKADDRDIYTRVANTTGKVGYLKDADWIYTVSTEYNAETIYTIILNDKVGVNESFQFGNQIAHELLGLGYTVLYKLLTNVRSDLEDSNFWECFKDKASYDFRTICTGGFASAAAYKCIYNIANHLNSEKLEDTNIPGRGDCVALIDVDETGFAQKTVVKNIKDYVKTLELGKYAAIFCPRVTYTGEEDATYKNLTFPASFHYLACAAYARNELNFNEWYAVAGYTRGVCAKTIAATSFKLGEIAINALEPRTVQSDLDKAVNLITNIRGSYYVWGNRTAHKLDNDGLVASHFLNIRQLCCTLKKQIYVTCRKLTFNPNSDILWGDFCNAIKPILEKMKADQGISNYKIIKVKEARKALLTAKIRIVPIEAVEDFDISIYLEDDISGVKVGTEE